MFIQRLLLIYKGRTLCFFIPLNYVPIALIKLSSIPDFFVLSFARPKETDAGGSRIPISKDNK
jgi:hypothetical protein